MRFAIASAAALLLGAAPAALHAGQAQQAPMHPATIDLRRAEARAYALVRQMTQAEKLALVHGYFPPMASRTPGAPPASELVPSAGHIPGIPRLGIPTVRQSDASLGVANQVEQRKGDTATALPASILTASTFDPAIAFAGGAMAGSEARSKRFNTLLAGGVNLTRDPWNGRNFEYLGEDPLLAGTLAGASIAGVQTNHIISTIKHYVLNAQETGRMVLNARIGEAALRESDLLAFEIAIEHGQPGSVMCAYNQVNGDYACENAHTLTDVLRKDWGYKGFVMSDWGAVHSTVKAANAGLDQESGQELDKTVYFGKPLADAVKAGQVPQARLDEMVRRILTAMIAAGLMDHPMPAAAETPDYAAHAEVAQRAAEAGIVLLKNERNLLPLARTAKRIVLIGGHADVGVLSGGGSSQVRSVGGLPVEIPLTSGAASSFARISYHASSPMRAIQALAPGAQVRFVDGSDPGAAAAAAKGADLAIVFATRWDTEAQDSPDMRLPDNQDALIAAVAAANPKTAVVLETGNPVLMPWIDRVGAVVEAWYPGQRGGEAIARVLFGEVNPSGHLPITWPATADQPVRKAPVGLDRLNDPQAATAAANAAGEGAAPEHWPVDYVEGSDVGYRWYEKQRMKPLFPFGHGLSYTRFTYANVAVTGGKTLTVSFDVKNTGPREGADVAQFYVQANGRPARLGGFQRVTLRPGETRRVTLVAEPRVLANWDDSSHGWQLAGGRATVFVAHDAADRSLSRTVDLDPQRLAP